jgi:4'-phosphopantetheinyl transferase
MRSLHDPCVREPADLDRENEILLWLGQTGSARDGTFHQPGTLSVTEAEALLDAHESGHLARFVHLEDRISYLAAHAGARLLLGGIAGRKADRLRFERSSLGKPALVDAPAGLDFSISHTRGAVAVAASYMPTGVDIEPLREIPDLNETSETVLASEERRVLARAPAALRSRLFLRYWTIKESILKAAGVGFTVSPNTLIVDAGPSPAVLSMPAALGSAEQWRVIAAAT